MIKLRINPLVEKDLKEIREYVADDNPDKASETINNIYGIFEQVQLFPGSGVDLSKRVNFKTNYKYAIWENYIVI